MDDTLRTQRDFALRQLEDLMGRGRPIGDALQAHPDDARSLAAARAWQQASAAAIHQLSGGSKAHWLSRAFSGALLIRSAEGDALVEANVGEIVDRILDVLAQGAASLSSMDEVETASSGAAPRPRRFEFVHNVELRPVCEQAFDDSRDALARNEYALALILSCGLIDALLTDALEHRDCGLRIADCGFDPAIQAAVHNQSAIGNPQSTMTFEARIAEAERAGLIRGGCGRLPPVARTYRDLTDANGELRPDVAVSERAASRAGQVLHVVMRDLDPGR
jgi:hypothetical protein